MEPQIVALDTLYLVGLPFYGDASEGQFGKTWDRFIKIEKQIKKRVNQEVTYGVEIYGEEFHTDQKWVYFPSVAVSDLAEIPDILFGKILPAATYAVFTVKGGLDKIPETFRYAYDQWLPASKYEMGYAFDFELYDERFKGREPDSELDLYLPVKLKNG